MSEEERFKLRYYAANQIIKVRFVMVFALLVGIGLLVLAYVTATGIDSNPTEFGERIFWTVVIVVVAVAFPAALWVYADCYVESIEVDNDSGEAIYHTLTLFGTRPHSVTADQIESRTRNEGKVSYGSSTVGPIVPRVNAPWMSVRVTGRRLPFIIDGQGFYVHWKKNGEFELKKAY